MVVTYKQYLAMPLMPQCPYRDTTINTRSHEVSNWRVNGVRVVLSFCNLTDVFATVPFPNRCDNL